MGSYAFWLIGWLILKLKCVRAIMQKVIVCKFRLHRPRFRSQIYRFNLCSLNFQQYSVFSDQE